MLRDVSVGPDNGGSVVDWCWIGVASTQSYVLDGCEVGVNSRWLGFRNDTTPEVAM